MQVAGSDTKTERKDGGVSRWCRHAHKANTSPPPAHYCAGNRCHQSNLNMSLCTLTPPPSPSTHTHTPPPHQQGRTHTAPLRQLHKNSSGVAMVRGSSSGGSGRQAGRFFFPALPEDHQLEQESGQSAAANTRGRGRSPGSCGLIVTATVTVLAFPFFSYLSVYAVCFLDDLAPCRSKCCCCGHLDAAVLLVGDCSDQVPRVHHGSPLISMELLIQCI